MNIQFGPPHPPFSDYEPKEPSASELARVGVTIVAEQGSLTYLRCGVCGWFWAVHNMADHQGAFWICPQDTQRGSLLKLTEAE
jgi:hypothetical protein